MVTQKSSHYYSSGRLLLHMLFEYIKQKMSRSLADPATMYLVASSLVVVATIAARILLRDCLTQIP
jgi:hypothetical protein